MGSGKRNIRKYLAYFIAVLLVISISGFSLAEDIPGFTLESTPDINSTSPSEQHSPPVQVETLGISEQGTSGPVNPIVEDPSPIPTATLSKIPVFEESIGSSVPISLAIMPSISPTIESSRIFTSPETFTPVTQESIEQTITPSQTPSPCTLNDH